MKLQLENKHKRDERIRFEEKPHLYYIDGSTDGYISATTLIHSFFDKFDSDKIINKMMESPYWSTSKYYGLSKDTIKKIWERNGKEVAYAGTKMHLHIEHFYNDVDVRDESIEFKYFLKFYDDHPQLKAYRTEWTIFDTTLKLAGSIDMLYIDDNGDYHIYDWKRCKKIDKENKYQKALYPINYLDDCNYVHYSLQLNLYRKLLKLNYNIEVKSMFLVQLHPENNSYVKYECPIMDKEIMIIFASRLINLKNKN